MDDRTIDSIFLGSLESLPPVSSKIVRIFTSSTFTGGSANQHIWPCVAGLAGGHCTDLLKFIEPVSICVREIEVLFLTDML